MSIAVVGGAGLVGSALVARLQEGGARVVVVDRARPRQAVGHLRIDLLEATAPAALTVFLQQQQVERVVHLVARVDPPKDAVDRALMRRLHDEGSRVVVAAARAVGVTRLVLVSSAVVYGAHADNPVPLTEDAPPRPCPFPYAEDKALQEHVVATAWGAAGASSAGLTIVRPAIVYGRQARSYLTEILRRARLPLWHRGFLPALDGHRPPLQFVHVDDVAAVVAAAVTAADDNANNVNDVDGVFHACAPDWLPYAEVARLAGLTVVDVPTAVAGPLLDRLVPLLPPSLRAPSALFPYLMHPFVLSAEKTRRVLGVTTSSSAAALSTLFG